MPRAFIFDFCCATTRMDNCLSSKLGQWHLTQSRGLTHCFAGQGWACPDAPDGQQAAHGPDLAARLAEGDSGLVSKAQQGWWANACIARCISLCLCRMY